MFFLIISNINVNFEIVKEDSAYNKRSALAFWDV